ncbi:hypothetical protein KIN20_017295 [Parelaphostrongylus tenuis]|uniref:Uncharacterized protein n=1 Tax=Parelaphostrongylus tenuis TaxID=148309 RepID=A0AAD5MLB2_PARTN|nr:hypothetical protein KIN20_017295 [Parelaphostrongylus tenuis]
MSADIKRSSARWIVSERPNISADDCTRTVVSRARGELSNDVTSLQRDKGRPTEDYEVLVDELGIFAELPSAPRTKVQIASPLLPTS